MGAALAPTAEDNVGMGGRLTSVAGLILLLIAVPFVFFGIGFLLYGIISLNQCQPTSPVCRSGGLAFPLLGALVIGTGILHGVLGIGIVLRRRRALIAGLVVSIIGALGSAYVSLTSLQPIGAVLRDPAIGLEPVYDNGRFGGAAGVVAYGIVVALSLISLRQRRDRPSRAVEVLPRVDDGSTL